MRFWDIGAQEIELSPVLRTICRVAEFQTEATQLGERTDPAAFEITTTVVRPRKTDINVRDFCLAWLPHWLTEDGSAEAAYR